MSNRNEPSGAGIPYQKNSQDLVACWREEVDDLHEALMNTEATCATLRIENNALREQILGLENKYERKEEEWAETKQKLNDRIDSHKTKTSKLETELKKRSDEVDSCQEEIAMYESKIIPLQEVFFDKKAKLEKMESSCEVLNDEIGEKNKLLHEAQEGLRTSLNEIEHLKGQLSQRDRMWETLVSEMKSVGNCNLLGLLPGVSKTSEEHDVDETEMDLYGISLELPGKDPHSGTEAGKVPIPTQLTAQNTAVLDQEQALAEERSAVSASIDQIMWSATENSQKVRARAETSERDQRAFSREDQVKDSISYSHSTNVTHQHIESKAKHFLKRSRSKSKTPSPRKTRSRSKSSSASSGYMERYSSRRSTSRSKQSLDSEKTRFRTRRRDSGRSRSNSSRSHRNESRKEAPSAESTSRSRSRSQSSLHLYKKTGKSESRSRSSSRSTSYSSRKPSGTRKEESNPKRTRSRDRSSSSHHSRSRKRRSRSRSITYHSSTMSRSRSRTPSTRTTSRSKRAKKSESCDKYKSKTRSKSPRYTRDKRRRRETRSRSTSLHESRSPQSGAHSRTSRKIRRSSPRSTSKSAARRSRRRSRSSSRKRGRKHSTSRSMEKSAPSKASNSSKSRASNDGQPLRPDPLHRLKMLASVVKQEQPVTNQEKPATKQEKSKDAEEKPIRTHPEEVMIKPTPHYRKRVAEHSLAEKSPSKRATKDSTQIPSEIVEESASSDDDICVTRTKERVARYRAVLDDADSTSKLQKLMKPAKKTIGDPKQRIQELLKKAQAKLAGVNNEADATPEQNIETDEVPDAMELSDSSSISEMEATCEPRPPAEGQNEQKDDDADPVRAEPIAVYGPTRPEPNSKHIDVTNIRAPSIDSIVLPNDPPEPKTTPKKVKKSINTDSSSKEKSKKKKELSKSPVAPVLPTGDLTKTATPNFVDDKRALEWQTRAKQWSEWNDWQSSNWQSYYGYQQHSQWYQHQPYYPGYQQYYQHYQEEHYPRWSGARQSMPRKTTAEPAEKLSYRDGKWEIKTDSVLRESPDNGSKLLSSGLDDSLKVSLEQLPGSAETVAQVEKRLTTSTVSTESTTAESDPLPPGMEEELSLPTVCFEKLPEPEKRFSQADKHSATYYAVSSESSTQGSEMLTQVMESLPVEIVSDPLPAIPLELVPDEALKTAPIENLFSASELVQSGIWNSPAPEEAAPSEAHVSRPFSSTLDTSVSSETRVKAPVLMPPGTGDIPIGTSVLMPPGTSYISIGTSVLMPPGLSDTPVETSVLEPPGVSDIPVGTSVLMPPGVSDIPVGTSVPEPPGVSDIPVGTSVLVSPGVSDIPVGTSVLMPPGVSYIPVETVGLI